MFLSTHAAAGMLLGVVFHNPAAAFVSGAASHFLLDMIPHEHSDDLILEYPQSTERRSKRVRRRTVISIIDISMTSCVIGLAWILCTHNVNGRDIFIPMISGIAGGLLPDAIVTLTLFMDNRFLRQYFKLHNNTHFVISQISVPRSISVLYQCALSALFYGAACILLR